MTPQENKNQFQQISGDGFELNTSKFVLSNDARKALLSMRAAAMLDKVNINSMAFVGRPTELMEAMARSDVELLTFDFLLDTDTTNRDNLENDNEPTA